MKAKSSFIQGHLDSITPPELCLTSPTEMMSNSMKHQLNFTITKLGWVNVEIFVHHFKL